MFVVSLGRSATGGNVESSGSVEPPNGPSGPLSGQGQSDASATTLATSSASSDTSTSSMFTAPGVGSTTESTENTTEVWCQKPQGRLHGLFFQRGFKSPNSYKKEHLLKKGGMSAKRGPTQKSMTSKKGSEPYDPLPVSALDPLTLSACPHTKQFIPKLYNDTSYKESSYKFQDVHTQETSSLKNHRINSRVSTHKKKVIPKLYNETSYRCAVCYCAVETETETHVQHH